MMSTTSRELIRTCPVCGVEYTGRTDKKTCGSDRCRKAYYRLRQNVPLNANGTTPKQLGIPTFAKSPRLICGKAEDMAAIQSESVDLIITSPPYNLEDWGFAHRPRVFVVSSYDDVMPEPKYQARQLSALREMYRVATPGASLFYNHQDRSRADADNLVNPLDWLSSVHNPWNLRQVIIWTFKGGTNNTSRRFLSRHQYIYWLTKGDPKLGEDSRLLPNADKGKGWRLSTVWDMLLPGTSHQNKPDWHQVPFPYELPLRCLEAIGRKNITVLDPYCGTCTTLKAAIDYGCEAIGNELCRDFLERAIAENGWLSAIEAQ